MASNESLTPDRWSLQRQCDFISRLYWLFVGGMTVVTLFQHGEETVVKWRFKMLNRHQSGHFIEGLKKLGIDPDNEPPAVVAAKYHYFSNGLGGIDLEMVVESPKKAWIRYNSPYVPDGTGWLANPPSVGRAPFEGLASVQRGTAEQAETGLRVVSGVCGRRALRRRLFHGIRP